MADTENTELDPELEATAQVINEAVDETEAKKAENLTTAKSAETTERPKIDHQLLEDVLDAIRPSFQADGGDIELIGVDDETGVVTVEMTGACAGCMFAASDVSQGIDTIICEHVPGVTSSFVMSRPQFFCVLYSTMPAHKKPAK